LDPVNVGRCVIYRTWRTADTVRPVFGAAPDVDHPEVTQDASDGRGIQVSRRAAAVAVISAVLVSILTSLASPAQAASYMQIDVIYFDPAGADTGSNINQEYIRLKNTDSVNHTLTGWTVRDTSGHVYKFPTTTIKAKSTVTLRSGKGTDGISTRYWQQSWYVWNNDGDKADLRGPSGTLIDGCSYTGVGAYKTC
jgi:hypothetical protein